MESRIARARARANRANNVLLASAAALFVAAMIAARLAHPARASQPATTSTATSSNATQTYDDGSSGEYDYGSGSIAPSQSAPQVATGGS